MVVAWNAAVEQSTEGSNPSLSSIYNLASFVYL